VKRIAVVGGGIGGLTAALRLRQRAPDDCEIVVFEARDRVGGVLHTESRDGYSLEHAANGFLGSDDGAIALADELGVEVESASPAARNRWIYIDGRLHKLPSNPLEAITTDLLSPAAKLRVLTEPLRPARPTASPGDESVGDFARRRLGPEVARAIVAPFVTGIFAGDADEVSLRAGFPALADLESRGGLFRGMISKMLDKRRAGASERPGPRRKGLMAPVGGVSALIGRLREELEGHVRTGELIAAMEPQEGGWRLRGPSTDERFDAVCLAMPAYRSRELVQGFAPEAAEALGEIFYAPAVVAHLGFRRQEVEHPLDGFGLLVAAGEPLRLLGCVFESVIWSGRAPDDRVLLRCIMGGTRDPSMVDAPDDEVYGAARRDLETALGLRAEPDFRNIVRWPRAIPQYELGHLDRVGRAERSLEPRGVALAGSGFHGVAVNSCVADADRVANSLLRHVGLLAILLFVWFAGGCSGGNRAPEGDRLASAPASASASATNGDTADSPAGDDDGEAGRDERPGAEPSDEQRAEAERAKKRELSIKVVWPTPAPASLVSPGRNACDVPRAAPLPVDPLGAIAERNGLERSVAVAGVVVELRGEGTAATAAAAGADRVSDADADDVRVAVTDCAPHPRTVVLGAESPVLTVVNNDERRHRVRVEHLGAGPATGEAGAAPRLLAVLDLAVVGQQARVAVDRPGVVRVVSAAAPDEPSFAIAPGDARVALTDVHGRVAFANVASDDVSVRAWYPAGAVAARTETTVSTAADGWSHIVRLKP